MINLAIERFDLQAYIRDKGAFEVQPGEWLMMCPTCLKDKLVVNVKKKTWHCWVCQQLVTVKTEMGPKVKAQEGAGGLLDLLQMLEDCNRKRAVNMVLAGSLITAKDLAQITRADFYHQLHGPGLESPEIAAPAFCQQVTSPLPYMVERGISMDDAQMFGLGWCSKGRYENRLVFPVFEQGRLVYWQARAMWSPLEGDRSFRKTLNPSSKMGGASPNEVLMNLDMAAQYLRVAIVEGPIDLAHAGPSAVATLGKKISPVQIAKLIKAGVRAVDLMWDSDARQDMLNASELLMRFFDTRCVFLPRGDPGDWDRLSLDRFRAMSKSFCQTSLIASV